MSLQTLLVHRADLQRMTKTTDSKGVRTATVATVIPLLQCRVQPLSSREALQYKQASRETTHRVYCETKTRNVSGVRTIADIIKGLPNAPGGTCRLKFRQNGITRYFQVEGQFDTDEANRLTVLDVIERDETWLNQ